MGGSLTGLEMDLSHLVLLVIWLLKELKFDGFREEMACFTGLEGKCKLD